MILLSLFLLKGGESKQKLIHNVQNTMNSSFVTSDKTHRKKFSIASIIVLFLFDGLEGCKGKQYWNVFPI